MKKRSIFWKIYLTLILIAVLPAVVSSLQLVISYQSIIDKIALGISQENLDVSLKNLFIQGALTILFFVIIITSFGALLLTRSFLSPLRKIARKMKAVAQGKLDTSLEGERKDEFGDLIRSFNGMVEDLKKSQTALEEAKAVLEIKVAARTKELQEISEGLEEKVNQRTKDLQDKIAELERLQNLTVGRELKMVELKRELERAKKYGSKKRKT